MRDYVFGTTQMVPVMNQIGAAMSKRGRKRRSRKKNAANHGNRPNA